MTYKITKTTPLEMSPQEIQSAQKLNYGPEGFMWERIDEFLEDPEGTSEICLLFFYYDYKVSLTKFEKQRGYKNRIVAWVYCREATRKRTEVMMYVLRNHRKRGIGKKLINRVKQMTKENGSNIKVYMHDRVSSSFYEGCGLNKKQHDLDFRQPVAKRIKKKLRMGI